METIVFYILAASIILCSLFTVISGNILRSAVYLLFVLGATAGLYFMIEFNFLAAVQITVYAGGIVVLIIFSILLTQQINTKLEEPTLRKKVIARLTSVGGFSVFLYALSFLKIPSAENEIADAGIRTIGNQLMSYGDNGYVLPFEVISILLLASMIAAIIIAKKSTGD